MHPQWARATTTGEQTIHGENLAMAFARDEVEKVAHLARLALSESEMVQMSQQLSAILDYVEQLRELDTTNVEPMAHCLPIQNVFRADEPVSSLAVDQALANAPKRVGDFYAVPAILE